MITEKDLQEAIAECQGERNPNSQTCIKLAAFYIIQDHLYPQDQFVEVNKLVEPAYSYAPEPIETTIDYISDTDFSRAIDGRPAAQIWAIMDELMDVLHATNPRLYAGVMRKIGD